MKRGALVRPVVRALAARGSVDLWSYLLAFHDACEILGGRLPGPLGRKGYNERCVGMCLAAAMTESSRRTS